MYQCSGYGPNNDYLIVTHIKVNSVIQKHTVYYSGNSYYYGNFGLWQGSLNSGTHTILVEYRNKYAAKNEALYWQTRTLSKP